MDPGKAEHIAGLVVGASEKTSTSSSSARVAEREEEKGPTTVATAGPGERWRALAGRQRWGHAVVGLGCRPRGFEAPAGGAPGRPQGCIGSATNGAKAASTGPPTWPRHDPAPERPQAVWRVRAPRHRRQSARRRLSKGPPQVGTVPGPLPTASAAGLGPDQGGGPRRGVPTSPEGREATARRRTDVGHGGGRLWGRGLGRGRGSSVQRQTALDLHHSTGRAPAGTGLAGLEKPDRGHTAQDCASQGLELLRPLTDGG